MRSEAYLHEGRIIRVTPKGVIRSETRRVKLTMEDGHVYPRKGWNPETRKEEKKMVITATGFAHLGNLAGFTFLSPGTLFDESGREVGNPIIKRENGMVSYVRIRRIGIGRSANGDLRALDRTLTYDVLAYYFGDLYQAYSSEKGGGWGEVVNVDFARELVKQDKGKAIAHVGPGIALVYNLQHKDVVRRVRENNQRALFGDRLAVSVCDRNILKSHFGFSNAPDDGVVELVSWPQADMDWESIRLNLSARSGVIDLDGLQVKVEVSDEKLEDAEDLEASGESLDLEDGVKRPADVQSEGDTHTWVPSIADLRQRSKDLGHERFKELVADVLTKYGLRLGDLGTVTDQKVIDDVWDAVKPKPAPEGPGK